MRVLGDPKKKSGGYRDVLLASVDSSRAASIPPQMLDDMQSIIDAGDIMSRRDDLKKYLGVLVDQYGLDTSKLADNIADYKAEQQDMSWMRKQAERAKLGEA
jgi:hypothetical protein